MPSQPTLPELPPMQPASSAPASERSAPSAPSAPAARSGPSGPKRLRQAVTAVAGGGFALTAAICAGQLALKPGLRPSDLMATIEAQTELGLMNQKMGVEPGHVLLTEADFRAKIAEAERSGQAKVDLVYQRNLAAIQSDKERVVAAYATLYQRTNIIAQAAVQLETIAQQFRQQLLTMSNGPRSMVIGFKDLLCGLGSPEACASAHEDRASMISEADALSRGDVGKRVRELLSDIDDPATLVAREDRRRNGVPTVQR